MSHYSIVVPAYNAEDTLVECLQAILSQDYPTDLFEVLVIDDGSTDNTVAIASAFPVRLIRLEANEGRIVARRRGAQAASYDRIVFVDTRVILPNTYLRTLAEIAYLPVIPHVITTGGPFNRVLSLFRVKYYRPYFPLALEEAYSLPSVMIDGENWLRMPKGTTTFACTRQQWLDAQPAEQNRYISDDTMILQNIQQQTPLLKAYRLTITYQQREKLADSLYHLYERGPRFLSYYLVAGGPYHRLAIHLLLLLAVLFVIGAASIIAFGPVVLFAHAILAFLGLLGTSFYFSQRFSDIPLLLIMIPLIGSAFGVGLLWGAVVHRDKLFVRSHHVF